MINEPVARLNAFPIPSRIVVRNSDFISIVTWGSMLSKYNVTGFDRRSFHILWLSLKISRDLSFPEVEQRVLPGRKLTPKPKFSVDKNNLFISPEDNVWCTRE